MELRIVISGSYLVRDLQTLLPDSEEWRCFSMALLAYLCHILGLHKVVHRYTCSLRHLPHKYRGSGMVKDCMQCDLTAKSKETIS